jgi:hypothetical protein
VPFLLNLTEIMNGWAMNDVIPHFFHSLAHSICEKNFSVAKLIIYLWVGFSSRFTAQFFCEKYQAQDGASGTSSNDAGFVEESGFDF